MFRDYIGGSEGPTPFLGVPNPDLDFTNLFYLHVKLYTFKLYSFCGNINFFLVLLFGNCFFINIQIASYVYQIHYRFDIRSNPNLLFITYNILEDNLTLDQVRLHYYTTNIYRLFLKIPHNPT